MSIDRIDFDNLQENDLKELNENKISEGLRIDYKRDLYGNTDSDKREALKDCSGFANSFGGHIIIGIEEENGLPNSIKGITDINPDDVILRLEQLILYGIEPRIQGIRIKAIPLTNGAHCFVIRIPRSWYPPHRVCAQNKNRFWIRHSGGTHEASMEELRTLFTFGADALHRIHQFRDERIKEIISGNMPRPLHGNGRFILHIVPLAAVMSNWQVDLSKVIVISPNFAPIKWDGYTPRFNFEGFINERSGKINYGYTQIFRNGSLEATDASIINAYKENKSINGLAYEKRILTERLPNYLNGLRDIGVSPPLIIMFTLEGVKGVIYNVSQHISIDPDSAIDREILRLPDCIINEYGLDKDYHRALKPAFDALWNTAGYVSANTFSPDGIWVGENKK